MPSELEKSRKSRQLYNPETLKLQHFSESQKPYRQTQHVSRSYKKSSSAYSASRSSTVSAWPFGTRSSSLEKEKRRRPQRGRLERAEQFAHFRQMFRTSKDQQYDHLARSKMYDYYTHASHVTRLNTNTSQQQRTQFVRNQSVNVMQGKRPSINRCNTNEPQRLSSRPVRYQTVTHPGHELAKNDRHVNKDQHTRPIQSHDNGRIQSLTGTQMPSCRSLTNPRILSQPRHHTLKVDNHDFPMSVQASQHQKFRHDAAKAVKPQPPKQTRMQKLSEILNNAEAKYSEFSQYKRQQSRKSSKLTKEMQSIQSQMSKKNSSKIPVQPLSLPVGISPQILMSQIKQVNNDVIDVFGQPVDLHNDVSFLPILKINMPEEPYEIKIVRESSKPIPQRSGPPKTYELNPIRVDSEKKFAGLPREIQNAIIESIKGTPTTIIPQKVLDGESSSPFSPQGKEEKIDPRKSLGSSRTSGEGHAADNLKDEKANCREEFFADLRQQIQAKQMEEFALSLKAENKLPAQKLGLSSQDLLQIEHQMLMQGQINESMRVAGRHVMCDTEKTSPYVDQEVSTRKSVAVVDTHAANQSHPSSSDTTREAVRKKTAEVQIVGRPHHNYGSLNVLDSDKICRGNPDALKKDHDDQIKCQGSGAARLMQKKETLKSNENVEEQTSRTPRSTSLGWSLEDRQMLPLDPTQFLIERTLIRSYQLATTIHKTSRSVSSGPTDVQSIDREINVYQLLADPQILEFEDILSVQECDRLLQLAEKVGWVASKTSIGSTGADPNSYNSAESKSRTSFSSKICNLNNPLVNAIQSRIARFMNIPESHIEPMTILRYHPGQQFKTHHDGDFRTHSMLIYLNDVEEGGETEFPCLGIALTPKKGFGLCFTNCSSNGELDARTLHAGLPVIKGVKYCLPVFFNKKKMT